jgi:hypothetical protein
MYSPKNILKQYIYDAICVESAFQAVCVSLSGLPHWAI